MAILSPIVLLNVRGTIVKQQWQVQQWYKTNGAAFLTATAAGVAEAYWNDIKGVMRATIFAASDVTFDSILCSEPGSLGAYGEYAVPLGERSGTRTVGVGSSLLPPFNAAGVRLTVATRATRPGQKRFVGVLEEDSSETGLTNAYVTLINTLASKFSSVITLGAPVATGTLTPVVVKSDTLTAETIVWQEVTGHIVNPFPTSQVSRKIGRGA